LGPRSARTERDTRAERVVRYRLVGGRTLGLVAVGIRDDLPGHRAPVGNAEQQLLVLALGERLGRALHPVVRRFRRLEAGTPMWPVDGPFCSQLTSMIERIAARSRSRRGVKSRSRRGVVQLSSVGVSLSSPAWTCRCPSAESVTGVESSPKVREDVSDAC
jgi:hypothetical protein